jgi:succinoglycan biosynthesis protein ExoM
MGQTHGRMLLEAATGLGRWRAIALAGTKSAYCFVAAALLAASPVKRHRYGLRGIMHAGVVSGLFGVREIEQYGNLEKAPQ